jgi:GT2 family glycosyltransferase
MNRTEPVLDFSVVIPTCNRPDMLAETLSCLKPQKHADGDGLNYEVVVSDDSEGNETERMLQRDFPWVNYVRGPRQGPAANRNCGAGQAHSEWLVFTDDDCLPQPRWLNAFASHRIQNDVLEGKTLADRPRERFDEDAPINETGGYLWSCNFAVRRSVFEQLGGFDARFSCASMEDMEFHRRCLKNNFIPYWVPEAVVVHPYRRRKGSSFIAQQIKAVNLYTSIHRECARDFRLIIRLRNILRFVMLGLFRDGWAFRHRGFLRELYLRSYAGFGAWHATREWRKRNA